MHLSLRALEIHLLLVLGLLIAELQFKLTLLLYGLLLVKSACLSGKFQLASLILDVGLLDIPPQYMNPVDSRLQIINASSDMLILDLGENEGNYEVGNWIEFDLVYMGALGLLNSRYIDKKQSAAQKIYPHYFERFVTDGVEFNIIWDNPFRPAKNLMKYICVTSGCGNLTC